MRKNPLSKIGAPGVVIEVDESKISKRKFNRGHKFDEFWLFNWWKDLLNQ